MIRFQSGVDVGSTFAGGLTYDPVHHRVYLTGGTYARGFFRPEALWNRARLFNDSAMNSDCFLLTLQLNDTKTLLGVQDPTRLGAFADNEACGAIQYVSEHQRLIIAGVSSAHHYGPTDVQGDLLPTTQTLLGQVMSYSLLPFSYGKAPILPQQYLFGGSSFYKSRVAFPFAARWQTDDNQHQYVYVAALTSPYTGASRPNTHSPRPDNEIDWTYPYYAGNVWSIVIQRLYYHPSNATSKQQILHQAELMDRDWMQLIQPAQFTGLHPADLVTTNHAIYLIGSTQDGSDQFGHRNYQSLQDWDGFVTQLDLNTGKWVRAVRLATQFGNDELMHGACLSSDQQFLYVVGSSNGFLELGDVQPAGGVLYKIALGSNASQLDIVWREPIHGNATGIDCAVSHNDTYVYVAGETASNNGTLEGWWSYGGSDVFVAKFDAQTGSAEWTLQLGSAHDDTLARNGAVAVDRNDNLLLYGNTRGSLGRMRVVDETYDTTNDIFVLTVTHDGHYLPPDPEEFYQVPIHVFERGQFDWALVGYMIMTAVLLTVFLVLLYAHWRKREDVFGKKDGDDEIKSLMTTKNGSSRNDTVEEDNSSESDIRLPSSDSDEEALIIIPPIDVTEGYYPPSHAFPPTFSSSEEEKVEEETGALWDLLDPTDDVTTTRSTTVVDNEAGGALWDMLDSATP